MPGVVPPRAEEGADDVAEPAGVSVSPDRIDGLGGRRYVSSHALRLREAFHFTLLGAKLLAQSFGVLLLALELLA